MHLDFKTLGGMAAAESRGLGERQERFDQSDRSARNWPCHDSVKNFKDRAYSGENLRNSSESSSSTPFLVAEALLLAEPEF